MSSDGFGEHVDAVRVFKRDLETLKGILAEAAMAAIIVKSSGFKAVGPGPEGPESARLIRLWTQFNIERIDELLTGVDNTNEEADKYLRGFGGPSGT